VTSVGLTQPHRLLQHRLEHGGEITGRAIDYLQNFRGRGLLCQSFIALSGNRGRTRPRVIALGGALFQRRFKRSCPKGWCKSGSGFALSGGFGRFGQAAAAGSLTKGSSLNGAMVSSVM